MGEGSSPSRPLRAGRPGSTTAQPRLEECKHVSGGDGGVGGGGDGPHTFETRTDEGGREVVVVAHEADVSGGEAHRQQGFLAVH